MSKKIVLTPGGGVSGDDLVGRMRTVRTTSQAIVGLIAQGHEVIVTCGNGPQVGVINQAFKAATKTKAHSPMLPMSVRTILSQGYTSYDLQNILREELLSRGINKPTATLVTQVGVGANGPAFFNPTKPIGSFFTEQEAELLTKQGYILKEDVGRGYCHVVTSPKPADIIEEETVKVLVDAGQVMTTVGGNGILATHEGNHPCGASVVIDKDWASARLTEVIDADMLVILAVVEKVAINFGKEDEQWLNRLSLSDAEHFIEEGHFAKGPMLPKVEAVASSTRSCTGREALTTVLSKTKEGVKGKTGAVTCQ